MTNHLGDRLRGMSLVGARVLTLAPVVLAFPLGSLAVFGLGLDRSVVAGVIGWIYSTGLFASFTTSFWPLATLRGQSFELRAQSAVLMFAAVSYVTHLTWELGWLVLHDQIAVARDQAWAYTWWAYIDGGDLRYATAPPELLTIEVLSVINGLIGMTALFLWWWSGRPTRRAVLLMMATAVVHLYSASYYYLSEIFAGMPNVDTSNFTDMYIKFGLANAPWVTMPWLVLWWGNRRLKSKE